MCPRCGEQKAIAGYGALFRQRWQRSLHAVLFSFTCVADVRRHALSVCAYITHYQRAMRMGADDKEAAATTLRGKAVRERGMWRARVEAAAGRLFVLRAAVMMLPAKIDELPDRDRAMARMAVQEESADRLTQLKHSLVRQRHCGICGNHCQNGRRDSDIEMRVEVACETICFAGRGFNSVRGKGPRGRCAHGGAEGVRAQASGAFVHVQRDGERGCGREAHARGNAPGGRCASGG